MGLRNLLRRGKKEEARHGVTVQPQANGLPQVHKMSVSQESLDLLIKGRQEILQRRQQYVQEVQRLDALLQQQEGGSP